MRTIETKVFQYDELSETAKQKAREWWLNCGLDYDWWDSVYEDAKTIDCKIHEFDIDRGSYCKLTFDDGAEQTAELILKNHGEQCETYKTAKQYLSDRAELVKKYSDGVNTDEVSEGNEYDFDGDCDELDEEFRKSLSEDYRIMLSKEYDYLTSKESVEETIRANEYEFTADGKLF